MKSHIVFNTWSGAFFNPGGGEVQLLNTRKHLQKLGHAVELYDHWNPQRDLDFFHQFSTQFGVEYPMSEYRNLGKKIFLSTILWAEVSKDQELFHHLQRIFNLSDVLFTNSNLESQKLSKAYEVPIEKFHKTVNGISEEYLNIKTNMSFREFFKIEGDFILSVANIDRRKNTHLLAQACHELGCKLFLVGHVRDIPYFDKFRHRFHGMTYLGPVVDPLILKSAYQQAALFALPSLCETPGIAALEAASQGAKIVITNEGSTTEYFQDFVTYVDPLSLESIKQGIQSESAQLRDRKAISEHIVQNFTWDITARQVLAGYQRG